MPSHRWWYGATGLGRILGAKPCISQQEEMVLSNQRLHQQVGMGVVYPLHLVTCLGHLKGSTHLPGKPFVVWVARNLFWVPSTKVASAHGRHATLSTLSGTGESVPDLSVLTSVGVAVHLLSWHLQGRALPHPGVPGYGVPVAGDTPDLHLLWLRWSQPLPLASTNWLFVWCLPSLPSWQRQLIGLICSGIMFWALFCWWGCSLFSKGHPMPLPGGTGWLGPSSSSAHLVCSHPECLSGCEQINVYFSFLVGVCLRTFWSGLGFPTAGGHLGISSMSQGPGPPALAAAGTSVAAGEVMTSGEVHPLHPFFKEHSHHEGLLMSIPCKGQHLLIHPMTCSNKLLILPVICISKSCTRTLPGCISWWLCPFPLRLCRSPLKPKVLFYWLQDLLAKLLLCCFFTSALLGSLCNW